MNRVDARLSSLLGHRRGYWRVRRQVRRLRLAVVGRIFRARYTAGDFASNAQTVRVFLRSAVGPVLAVVAMTALIAVFNDDGRDLADKLGLGDVRASSYDVLLEAVIGATGVFLALYFAAVSSVVAAVYTTVPNDIRSLLIRDRFGNVYVRIVSFTMAFAVALLVVHTASSTTYPIALLVLGLLSVLSIFAFIRLGNRAFNLADPTLLADSLARDFTAWQRRAMRG